RQVAIGIEDDGLAFVDRPDNAERRIVPLQAALVIARIRSVHLIENLRLRLQSAESVGKTFRDKQLGPVFGAKGRAKTLPVGVRSAPDIDRNIKNGSAQRSDQLGLGEWRDLKMKSPDGFGRARQRLIGLVEFV